MLGTNDTGDNDSASEMINQLSTLIDQIDAYSPNITVLVASIPPIRSDAQSAARIAKANEFNAAIPDLVNDKQALGQKVKFVDMTSLTQNDITPSPGDNGLHPTDAGYSKIADFWFDELLAEPMIFSLDQDSLVNIENVVGSEFQDRLVGNASSNEFEGGGGSDWLTGGGGADAYFYRSFLDGGDVITDWSKDDIFKISAAGFGYGLVAGTSLAEGTESSTGTFVQGENAIGTTANFLYANGVLRFDPDGTNSHAAVTLAHLQGNPALNGDQIIIV
jgi:hypothetical protein